MHPKPEPSNAPEHAYDLFMNGQVVARLEWRTDARRDAGWYLLRPGEAERLDIDSAIDALALDDRSSTVDWELHAALGALLSAPLAIDTAERRLHGRPERQVGRFRRLSEAARFEIYVDGIDRMLLAHAVPELPVASVSDVCVLSGTMHLEAFERVARRVAVLGGRVVAVFRDDEDHSS